MPSDFIPLIELSELVGVSRKTLYNQHSAGAGPLSPIMVKLGGRLGCWRDDYEVFKDSQRRIKIDRRQAALAKNAGSAA